MIKSNALIYGKIENIKNTLILRWFRAKIRINLSKNIGKMKYL